MARTRSGARARDGGRHRLRQDVASVRQRAEGRAARHAGLGRAIGERVLTENFAIASIVGCL